MELPLLPHLTATNREQLLLRDAALADLERPYSIFWRRPCRLRVLVVTDGSLSFDRAQGFGLTDFISALLSPPVYVRFEITLAHITAFAATDPRMMPGEPRIANRIGGFKFDNPNHFAADRYDVVFLFGFAENYGGARGPGYPADGLSNAELQRIDAFQNGGGGVFATGDHGSLGRALCHKIARVRNMRLWQSTNNQLGEDMVSMLGRYRNDTNRRGHDGAWQFDDQSDDIPQTITPTMYSVQNGLVRYSFPHPLLCGPNGPIRVMPDHPHEGECRTPSDLNQPLDYPGALKPEYPAPIDGGPPVEPEIISRNGVEGGLGDPGPTPVKLATVPQSFPGIAAYDGHRAGVGRVVTDATWHHFVNVNLSGVPEYPATNPKRFGLLATAAGQAAYEDIKAYFRNLAIWLARPERIRCMNAHFIWRLIMVDHVVESVTTAVGVGLERASPYVLFAVGRHARDVLGRYSSRCQSQRLMLELIPEVRFLPEIDPWWPRPPRERKDLIEDLDLPVLDGLPLVEAAFGGALVHAAQKLTELEPERMDKLSDADILDIAREGAAIGFKRSAERVRQSIDEGRRALFGTQEPGRMTPPDVAPS